MSNPSTIEKDECMSLARQWIELEMTMSSRISQIEKDPLFENEKLGLDILIFLGQSAGLWQRTKRCLDDSHICPLHHWSTAGQLAKTHD